MKKFLTTLALMVCSVVAHAGGNLVPFGTPADPVIVKCSSGNATGAPPSGLPDDPLYVSCSTSTAIGSDPTKVLKAGDTMTGQLTLKGSTLTVTGQDSSGYSVKTASGINAGSGCILLQGGLVCGPSSGGGGAPSGPAGGDLSGTYPNPLVSHTQAAAVDFSTITTALAGKLSNTAGVPPGLIDLSTVTTALAGKLSNTVGVPPGLIDLSTVTTALAGKLSNTVGVPPGLINLSTVTAALATKVNLGDSITVPSGTFTSSGATQYSIQTSSGINLLAGCLNTVNGPICGPSSSAGNITGTGVAGQLAIFDSASDLLSSATLAYDAAGDNLSQGAGQLANGGHSAVIGGENGMAAGLDSVVLGGANNNCNSTYCFMVGGSSNTSGSLEAFVAGGDNSNASGPRSSIVGGNTNLITGDGADSAIISAVNSQINTNGNQVVMGGSANIGSAANGALIGGSGNTNGGNSSVVIGGQTNNAAGANSVAIGGTANNVNGTDNSVILGSTGSVTSGAATESVIIGGNNNVVTARGGVAMGSMAQSTNTYSFVWSDDSGVPFLSTADNQFSIRASGGLNLVGPMDLSGTGSPTQGHALCINAGGRLSACTSVVAADGSCTCP